MNPMNLVYRLSAGTEARLAKAKPAKQFEVRRLVVLMNTPLGDAYEKALRKHEQLTHRYEMIDGKKVGRIEAILLPNNKMF